MGHPADEMVGEVKALLARRGVHLQGIADDEQIRANVDRARAQVQIVAGRTFGQVTPLTLRFPAGPLPLVEIPDLQLASWPSTNPGWPVPDVRHPEIATVLQITELQPFDGAPIALADVLGIAGQFVAGLAAAGTFRMAVSIWMRGQLKFRSEVELGRRLLDPDLHEIAPIGAVSVGGWWLQLGRRISIVTKQTPDSPRLVEPLFPFDDWGMLVASEPTLIIARVTEHPIKWAMAIRVWEVGESSGMPTWRQGAAFAAHRYGFPVLAIDAATGPDEASAHLLLLAHWYGYLSDGGDATAEALSKAYPREVGWVRRGTGSPNMTAAASQLWARLLSPGFDPSRGAASIRRYIKRQASTLVKEHKKNASTDHAWQRLGITERHYYKLLARFTTKGPDGRYDVDDALIDQLRRYIAESTSARERRAAAIALLQTRGFSLAAARKWLQRHAVDSIRTAQPRTPAVRARSGRALS